MVDIVQSNACGLLIRKIGYSAGLESTLLRLEQLADHYAEHRQLNEVGWRDLVVTQYGRKVEQSKHFANFFRALDLVAIDNGRPVPLPLLDSANLLREHYIADREKFRRSLVGLLLYSLTLADGELFSALLASGFSRQEIEGRLEAYRRLKLGLLYQRYPMPGQRRRLHQLIDFHELDPERGGLVAAHPTTGPFAAAPSKNLEDFRVSLSADWFRKVPPRRAGWARDLGLVDDDGILSEAGARYLRGLRDFLSPEDRSGDGLTVVIMPTDLEIRANHVTWSLDDRFVLDHLAIASVVVNSYAQEGVESAMRTESEDVDRLSWALEQYGRADTRFRMLRRDLPYTVYLAFELGCAVAERRPLGSPRKRLDELAKSNPSLLLRSSRNSLYGISFSRR